MSAFLLETTILTISLDARHPRHVEIMRSVMALPVDAPQYVSVVGLAELAYGANLAAAVGNADLISLKEKIRKANAYAVLDVNRHTADAYAETKAKLATKFLVSTLRRDRPRYLEDWIDKATGKALGIDENDLWMCAQAKERDLTLVTADARMQRIPDADPSVKLLLI